MLDTNILISGIIFSGVERKLINVCCSRGHIIVMSEYIISEANAVLKRKFPGKEFLLDVLLNKLEVEVINMPMSSTVEKARKLIRDPKDAAILASAIDGKPEIFVSGDLDFYTSEVGSVVNVISTRDALALLNE
ncbi:putative toxin-antitoxin system toxin component, PIN family [Dethiobacter alkaliphilus]|nr:putative toxin-antitoxin system toxin component, PIN family [Dethiobacter alkaliphilus]